MKPSNSKSLMLSLRPHLTHLTHLTHQKPTFWASFRSIVFVVKAFFFSVFDASGRWNRFNHRIPMDLYIPYHHIYVLLLFKNFRLEIHLYMYYDNLRQGSWLRLWVCQVCQMGSTPSSGDSMEMRNAGFQPLDLALSHTTLLNSAFFHLFPIKQLPHFCCAVLDLGPPFFFTEKTHF